MYKVRSLVPSLHCQLFCMHVGKSCKVHVCSILKVTNPTITEDAEHCQHCGDAYHDDDESRQQEWVGCDFCWRWFHYGCIGLEEIPEKDEQWKCPECL